ncbi:MAG: M14 family zinc carboxypeptidase [Acidobacteriota bacterium]|nr:M14 family zinc carboxypeptidase [Acidobacteriota bacterium]
MSTFEGLPIEEILATECATPSGRVLGRSREGRPIEGFTLGGGSIRVSLIGGCHADEPVGPAALQTLVAFLTQLPDNSPLRSRFTWCIVPHVNPDGRLRNESWTRITHSMPDHRGTADRGFVLESYLRHVTRELPGNDLEFGFPHHRLDSHARPENRSVAAFLSAGAPYHLHGSFHGMGFAPGAWFLLEKAWIERTIELRNGLRRLVASMGYGLFDPDRGGEKGFWRIDKGFSTRPDSAAMKSFFDAHGDSATAALFRPSSMEYVRALGGDPLTLVTEMPLFLTPDSVGDRDVGPSELKRLRRHLDETLLAGEDIESVAATLGIRAMPIRDQQRLQLAALDAALQAVIARR